MKVAIRADASTTIGSGHVMRCLTLANALRARGCDVLFVCRPYEGHLATRIKGEGIVVKLLPAGTAHWTSDARETLAALAGAAFSPDWMVVDHYGLDANWERAIRMIVRHIMVVDDLADRVHDCDVLLDQNLVAGYEHRYDGLTPQRARRLLGPQYALLQPRYEELREMARPRRGAVKRVLIYFGAADTAGGLTELALRAFLALNRSDIAADVVVGPANPQRSAIAALAQGQANVRIHDVTPSLASLMAEADLAVGASGTTSWERLYLHLPAIVVTLADNQRPIAEELDRLGCVRWLGDAADVSISDMIVALDANFGPLGVSWFNSAVAGRIDGLGANRVADVLVSKGPEGLVLREATGDDVDLYFNWANEGEVRRQSFDQSHITREQHIAWFNAKLASPNCRMYVLCEGSKPLGQIRFDIAGGIGRIAYSLDAATRGRGLAKVLVALGMDRMAVEGVRSFSARVKHGNHPSAAAFIRCGFAEGVADDYRIFCRKIPAGAGSPSKESRSVPTAAEFRSVG